MILIDKTYRFIFTLYFVCVYFESYCRKVLDTRCIRIKLITILIIDNLFDVVLNTDDYNEKFCDSKFTDISI